MSNYQRFEIKSSSAPLLPHLAARVSRVSHGVLGREEKGLPVCRGGVRTAIASVHQTAGKAEKAAWAHEVGAASRGGLGRLLGFQPGPLSPFCINSPWRAYRGIQRLGEGSQPGRCEGQPFCSPRLSIGGREGVLGSRVTAPLLPQNAENCLPP